jgi:hypothetical protein
VTLQEDAIAAAARELPPAAEVAAACQFMRLPIRFDSQAAEVGAGCVGRWMAAQKQFWPAEPSGCLL